MRPLRRTPLLLAAASLLGMLPATGAPRPRTCEQIHAADPWKCDQTQLMSRPWRGRANAASPSANPLVPDVTSPALSLDATRVAFSSDASNLVAGDTNGMVDVFVRETASNRIVRASTDRSGRQANGHSYSPALSVDGSKLAFVSAATNLVPGDTNGVADVFFKDLRTGTIRRVSVRSDGRQANAASNNPFISLFGDWVTFDSAASSLSHDDDNGLSDAFLWSRSNGSLRRLAVPQPHDPGMQEDRLLADGVAHTGSASISHDGKVIAYHRLVERRGPHPLLPALTVDEELPLAADVFVEAPRTWERKKLVPVNPPPSGCGPKSRPAPPCWRRQPGRWHGGDPIAPGRGLQRIAMAPWGGSARKMLEHPVVTADGRYVAFEGWSAITAKDTLQTTTDASPLARNDLGAACGRRYGLPSSHTCVHTDYRSVYIYDWYSETTTPVSTKLLGGLPTGDCSDPSPNAYGTVIAFTCDEYADNLVPGDANDAPDVFVKDLPGRATARVSISSGDGEGFGASTRPSISYDGRKIAFASTAASFVGGDTNGASDIFLRDRRTHLPNVPPSLQQPFAKTRAIDVGERFAFTMRANDPNRNQPLRYGALTPLPDGASIDPVSGEFRWTPSPDQTEPGGRFWRIVLWVSDPYGQIHPLTLSSMAQGILHPRGNLQLLSVFVRDPAGTARCDAHTVAPDHVSGACQPVE